MSKGSALQLMRWQIQQSCTNLQQLGHPTQLELLVTTTMEITQDNKRIIGVSLSEPHTSGTVLHNPLVYIHVYLYIML